MPYKGQKIAYFCHSLVLIIFVMILDVCLVVTCWMCDLKDPVSYAIVTIWCHCKISLVNGESIALGILDLALIHSFWEAGGGAKMRVRVSDTSLKSLGKQLTESACAWTRLPLDEAIASRAAIAIGAG